MILTAVVLIGTTMLASAFEPDIRDLRGLWKFRIGDHLEWASPQYDDSDWGDIRVPARWENEGFRGYDGFAWYRTSIVLPASMEQKSIVLELGYIDDADEVYFNGVKIGQTGSFPPNFSTAYTALRKYQVPNDLVHYGQKNLISVRVYDAMLDGGIVSG
ncbi:MAG TPA: beta galactosidase jelly roll domain-containing protein, partial [Sunxiuqinia sp.]|nr:beta galactosidase jelly roll domain-containing protein [Sunxiuqinia sp.]